MQIALAVILAAFVIFGLPWLMTGNSVALFRYFAPQVEQARRETFEQSKAYTQGQIQELSNMQFQYEQASPEHQAALRSIILRRASDFESDRLPPDVARFISRIRSER